MSETKQGHTPGPWQWDGDSCLYAPGPDVAVATLLAIPNENLRGTWDQEQARANARLIAAAPDLLAALEGILPWIAPAPGAAEAVFHYKARLNAARAAIAKAKGDA